MRAKFLPLVLCLASVPVRSEDPVVTLGKQRAAVSPHEWEIREANHPVLGPIRFAFLKKQVATPVGNARIASNVYISCERGAKKIAIELANATSPDDPGGLQPKAMPRLICYRLATPTEKKVVREELDARWQVNELGDALARGFRPFPLRECVSIDIEQEVVLPKGWARPSAPVEFEITPYSRELDSIFVACGEVSAYAPAAAVPSTAAAPPSASAPPSAPAPSATKTLPPAPSATVAPSAEAPWKQALTISSGRTNVRAKPSVDSAVVVQLPPGVHVLVRQVGNDWWHVKSAGRATFEGYIREDRLVFK